MEKKVHRKRPKPKPKLVNNKEDDGISPAKKTFDVSKKKALASVLSTLPCIWDLGHPDHKDGSAQLAAWETVSNIMNESGEYIVIDTTYVSHLNY